MRGYGVDELRESMVKILGPDGNAVVGSGFIIDPEGHLITCHHVICPMESLKVEYRGEVCDAEWCREYSDPEVDIAVLKIKVENARPVTIKSPKDPSVSVIAYGFPRERHFPEGFDVHARLEQSAPVNTLSTYTSRTVAGDKKLPASDSTFLSYRIDKKVDPGFSGGPVLAEGLGGIVGVVQSSRRDESYVIRWDNVRETLEKLLLEPTENAVCQFLKDVEDDLKYIKFFHSPQKVVLEEQYIPIQVTLERRYRHEVETTRGYAESEEEMKQAYAFKRMADEPQTTQVPWEEAREKHKRVMVLADPGMGKSTLLSIEARSTAQEERRRLLSDEVGVQDVVFPVFLRLSELASKQEILDAVPELVRRNYPRTSEEIMGLLKEKLDQGKCLLLLDALDEVPRGDRNSLSEKLNRFARNYPCSIICTSRIVGYGGGFLDDAEEVEIVPFSRKQIEQYVTTWFTNAADTIDDESISADALLRELRGRPQIHGLTQIPLLMSLICSLYQEKELTLPARRCQIYGKAVDYMLSRWSQNRNPKPEGWVESKTVLLAEIAHHFSCQGTEVFSRSELHAAMEGYLRSDRALIDFRNSTTSELIRELSEEDGIIQLEGAGEKYMFLHRTFQEYLTASHLNRSENGVELARKHFWEYDWHETLNLFAGLMKDPISLLQAIMDEKDDIFSSMLLLAGGCVTECEESSHVSTGDIIDRIHNLWTKYPSVGFINSAVVNLCRVCPQMLDRLRESLGDRDSDVRRSAADALRKMGSEKAVDALIKALEDQDSVVRESATSALGWIGSEKAVDALIVALEHRDSDVRESAVYALRKMGSEKAVDALIVALEDQDSFVRGSAADALGEIGSEKAVDALVAALGHQDIDVRWIAAYALASIGSEKAVDALIKALKHQDSVVVRGSVASALGEIGSEKAVDGLIVALEDQDSYVRGGAASALGWIGSEKAVDALIVALEHQDSNVRSRAAYALGRTGSEKAVDALIAALGHQYSGVRGSAAYALGEIDSEKAVDALIKALEDQDSDVRRSAADALRKIGSEKAVDARIKALEDQDSVVRESAANALGRMGSEKAVDARIKALEDLYSTWIATSALGKVGSEEVVDALIAALEDQDSNFRSGAAYMLGRTGSLETLEKIIKSPVDIYDPYVFPLARQLAVRFSREEADFIPVYPEVVEK